MTGTPFKEEDQLARFGRELREGHWHWLSNAQQRSQRRKSAWNLLLPLVGFPLWVCTSTLLVSLALFLHTFPHPFSIRLASNTPLNVSGALILFPTLIGSVCPALFLTNVFVYRIPAARRAMDLEDKDVPGTGYASSQSALLKAGLLVLMICLPMVFLGIFLA